MVLSTLFSTNTDAAAISEASPMTSYDWSDFPLVYQFNPDDNTVDFECNETASQSARSLDFQYSSKKNKLNDYNNDLYTSLSSTPPSLCSSVCSLASSDSCASLNGRDRRVSFARRVEVREYNLVLGDFLSCDVLPLSLGWNYSASTYEDYTCPETRRHGNQLKLSYAQRRNLLQQVGGYSEDELLQHKMCHSQTTTRLFVES